MKLRRGSGILIGMTHEFTGRVGRRTVLRTMLGFAALLAGCSRGDSAAAGEAGGTGDAVAKLDCPKEAWKKVLRPAAYAVLFEEDTERPFSSPLEKEHGDGTFVCAACALPLFESKCKFDSGTGWPSFWAPLGEDAVGTTTDRTHGMVRTEVHCAKCGGHLGHVFPDGPPPSGLRFCMNGVALTFEPADQ